METPRRSERDEYTPTTTDMRTAWVAHHIDAFDGDDGAMPMSRWEAEFDRWLASVRAQAVRDFALLVLPTEWAQRALEHANEIEKGEGR